MPTENRRTFIKQAGLVSAAVAGGVVTSRTVLGANERVVMGLIGGKGRGRGVFQDAVKNGGAIFKTFCDIDDAVLDKTGAEMEKLQGKKATTVKDYRAILDDPEIDAVMIATPDHWHAIQAIHACQAEKDIYVEKPLSHTMHEGKQMVKAARKYDRVAIMGTQRRSDKLYKTAVETVKSGILGKICLIKAWCSQVRTSIGNPPNSDVPPGVDYDRWLGPAPKRPFNENRFHYNWRFFWDYCNSELGNQGVHALDLCMWAIVEMRGIDNCLPTRVSGLSSINWLDDAKEVPDTQTLTYDYGDMTLAWELCSFGKHSPPEGAPFGLGFYGTEAALVASGGEWRVKRDGKPDGPSSQESGGSHAGHFLECVKTRTRPNADIEIGRLSTTICHIGNVATRLGREVMFDPKTETFGDDAEANAYMTKKYRAPYLLPEV